MEINSYLQNLKIESLTPLQQEYTQAQGNNLILLAHTGSGKTLAFVLKMLQFLANDPQGKVLILSPSRELSMQLFDVIKKAQVPYKSIVCYGGHSFKNEANQLRENVQIVVGTPGRILDHITRGTIDKADFKHLVIDEYDKTLEFGFMKEIKEILNPSSTYKSIQLVSATEIDILPEGVKELRFTTIGTVDKRAVKLEFLHLKSDAAEKLELLIDLLYTLDSGKTIVFCTHRETTMRIGEHLQEENIPVSIYHGGMEQSEREKALVKFKNSTSRFLICTDLAARGLDIAQIENVIHYQYPNSYEEFTHRNGRTARMNAEGNIYLLSSEEDLLPDYIDGKDFKNLPSDDLFSKRRKINSEWITLYISAGRKDKIRKMDILGFFTKEMGLDGEKIGMIDVFDSYTYMALDKNTYHLIKADLHKKKIKKISVRMVISR